MFDTIQQPIHVSPGHISFNDTVNYKGQDLTISNPSNQTVLFQVIHRPSLAMLPYNVQLQYFAPLQPPQYATENVQAVLDISSSYVTVEPGQSKLIRCEVTKVTGISESEVYPMYGGYIEFAPVNSTTAKSIHVPYIGVSGSLAKLPIFEEGFPRFLLTNGTRLFEQKLKDGTIDTGIVLDRLSRTTTNYVVTLFRLLTGSRRVETEVLDQDLKSIGVYSQEEYLTRNTLEDIDFVFAQRWNGTLIPNGKESIADLTLVPPGIYYLKYKGLKLMSDPSIEDSWETSLSPPILIKN